VPVTPCPASPTPGSPDGEAGGEAGGVEVADPGVEEGDSGAGVVVVDSARVTPPMDTIPTMAIHHPIDALRVE
jgi:hypothetical protein